MSAIRQIVLDTETTGIDIALGNRIIEIGCVELVERRVTGRNYHQYINPERDSEEGALRVHGLTTEFLSDKPLFADIAEEFLQFVDGAELIIHNAAFDIGHLNNELQKIYGPSFDLRSRCQVTDSLKLAKDMFPGSRHSLDALCKRFDVDNSGRELHGALLDALLLAEVYLAMTGGQVSLQLGAGSGPGANSETRRSADPALVAKLRVQLASTDELAAHEAQLEILRKKAGGPAVWDQLDS